MAARGRTALIMASALAIQSLGAAPTSAQLPEPGPDRFAISVGAAAIFPTGALSDQDPLADAYYATSGSAIVQRFSFAPWRRIGLFAEASFPAFGVDVDAVQRDFGADPPVVDGRNDISSWSAGVRWRRGESWLQGLYAEASIGVFRQQLELEQEGNDPQQDTYEWRRGGTVAIGIVMPLGTALALDAAAMFTQYREVNRGTTDQGAPFVNRWTNRWWGIRFLAVLTFGGGG